MRFRSDYLVIIAATWIIFGSTRGVSREPVGTTRWVGKMRVGVKPHSVDPGAFIDEPEFEGRSLSDIELGLVSDGVVVWRRVESTDKVDR